ncbi:MAG: peptide deformylase [Alphaproteobacteria bacterium]|nr:peptide deformylase [Alphaproteobacteria bacterium]
MIIIGVDPEANKKQKHHDKVETRIVINPELTVLNTKKIWGIESCLSVPGACALVPRHKTVRCTGKTVEGKPIEFVVSDYPSCILQHEVDHLDGRLFTSRIEENKALWARALFPLIMFFDLPELNKASKRGKDPIFLGPGILFENLGVVKKYRTKCILSGAYAGAIWNLGKINQWPWSLEAVSKEITAIGVDAVSKELLAIGAGAVIFPVLWFNAIGLREGLSYRYDLNDRYKKASQRLTSIKLYKKVSEAYRSCTHSQKN